MVRRQDLRLLVNRVESGDYFAWADFVNVHLVGTYKNSHFSRKDVLAFDTPWPGREKYKPHVGRSLIY